MHKMAESTEKIFKHRTLLPAPMMSRNEVSIWSILKNCIGKDLSKITMPVMLNEPLSFLQRLCEYMEYAYLLKQAAAEHDAVDRMKYVAAFAVSALASNWERLGKPFNPLLGETYELQTDDFRVICEQVSHHPPISAFHAECDDFKFHGSIHPKLKFWGKSIAIEPKGMVTIELPRWNEIYTWSNVNCCIHNIIVGKLWIEQYGTMEIINHTTSHRAILNFKSAGWSAKDLHKVEGFIQDANNKKCYFLYGRWTDFMKSSSFESYEDYVKKGASKTEAKCTTDSPDNTPKKVFHKLNSFKLNSFRSLSIQDNEAGLPPEIEGDIPRCESTYSLDIPGSELLWKCEKRPDNSSQFYQFSYFAMQLNERTPNMNPPSTLCPTDSRLRPDIRCLENGDLDGASREKTRLEEKQREARKHNKGRGQDKWTPKWFTYSFNERTAKEEWLYTGSYFDRDYSSVVQIF